MTKQSKREHQETTNPFDLMMQSQNKKNKKKNIDVSKFNYIPCRKNKDDTLKIVSWNVNGIRAVTKKGDDFLAYLQVEDPDILCLSETKISKENIKEINEYVDDFKYRYWSCAEKKGYSGTVVLSKVKPIQVIDTLTIQNDVMDKEGRFLALEFTNFYLVHTYVPNAGMKLDRLDYRTNEWDVALLKKLEDLQNQKPVIWCGDLNVAHEEIDIHDPIKNRNKSPGFTDAERNNFSTVLTKGFIDVFRHLNPKTQQFTYWSYRFQAREQNKGWRLDYFVMSLNYMKQVVDMCTRSKVQLSDHVPIVLILNKKQ